MSIYLDWAATTPPNARILAEAVNLACSDFANPSSVHRAGKTASTRLVEARTKCARSLGVKPETIIFTSGGTEADHLPLLALLQRPVRGSIAVSAIEHPALLEQAHALEHCGWSLIIIPATREGFITPEAVLSSLRDDTAFVAVMAVNNETGAIQPVAEISAALIARSTGKKKPHFHVDAVQAEGKIAIVLATPGMDSAALSAHKLQGPRGTGILYLAHRIEPFIRGGGQEGGLRPGTENLAGAWALAQCLEKAMVNLRGGKSAQETLMKDLIVTISKIKGISVIPESRTPVDGRFSPYIVQFTNTHVPGEVLVRSLSDRDIYISTGSACSSRKKTRPVLQAMHLGAEKQQNAFRISVGSTTTAQEISALAVALEDLLSTL
jgi:cysteine desulfurase